MYVVMCPFTLKTCIILRQLGCFPHIAYETQLFQGEKYIVILNYVRLGKAKQEGIITRN